MALLTESLRSSPRPATLVTLEPLTHVAAALQADPALARRIERVIVLGGAFEAPVTPDFVAQRSIRVILPLHRGRSA